MKSIIYLMPALVFVSCGEGFLEIKPSQRQRVPATIEDYVGMLDHTTAMNQVSSHYLGIIGSDEMEITDAQYQSFPTGTAHNYQKNAYTWEQVIYEGGEPNQIDWNIGYDRILKTNVVLAGLEKIVPKNESQKALWNMAKGTALFHRALNYHNLAQLYCSVYEKGLAADKLGLPLRLNDDVTDQAGRSSLQQTYEQILADLAHAGNLLPEFPDLPFRPSKWAVYALLTRICLQMGAYEDAVAYATQCISLKGDLVDFNLLAAQPPPYFGVYGENNPEVIFFSALGYGGNFRMTWQYYNAPQALLSVYSASDLRRTLYFASNGDATVFIGSYSGIREQFFTGLAMDEVYLSRAEAAARLGDVAHALDDVNHLRKHRYRAGYYTPLATESPAIALASILDERRRELVMRGTRWSDLRRLNKEAEFRTTLSRTIGDQTYILPPDDRRWVWPIPLEAVEIGGHEQNPR